MIQRFRLNQHYTSFESILVPCQPLRLQSGWCKLAPDSPFLKPVDVLYHSYLQHILAIEMDEHLKFYLTNLQKEREYFHKSNQQHKIYFRLSHKFGCFFPKFISRDTAIRITHMEYYIVLPF